MAIDVTVTVTGTQKPKGSNDTERVVTKSNGTFYKKESSNYVIYDDGDEPSEKISNIFKYSAKVAEITRKGALGTHMVFVPNEVTKTDYVTPYGIFDLEIVTHSLSISETPMRTTVAITYDMYINGGDAIKCTTEVKIDTK